MIEETKNYAIKCHADTCHYYDTHLYSYHLQMVVDVAERFLHLIPEKYREIVISACWAHDLIEDTRISYNDVKNVTCTEVAEISYALTHEKGRNRSDRANDKYYQGIRKTPFATFVKICDRIANIQYSMTNRTNMLDMYRQETPSFIEALYDESYSEMFDYLENLVGIKTLKD